MKYILGLALPFLLGTTLKAETSGLDVNDVAVLFPINPSTKELFPKISLDNQSALIPPSVLQEALAAAEKLGVAAPVGTVSIKNLGDYYVTAYRYDPCAPLDHMPPGTGECLAELRLVAQPFDNFGPSDTAIHLLYDLGKGLPKAGDEALAEIFRVKAKSEELMKLSTSALPLNVHPVLTAAMKSGNGDVAKLFENLVRKFARPDRLKKLTMMGLKAGSQTHWVFFGGNVIDGKWVQDSIPNLSDNSRMAVELNLNSGDTFTPPPTNVNDSTFGFFHRELLSDGQIDVIRQNIHKLENPDIINRNNSDCLSCHSATSLHTSGTAMVPLYIEGLTTTAPKGITAYPAQGLLQRHRLHWNMRAFGYFGIVPTLSMHTVNEAGRSAAKVNEILSRVNPGRDCSAVQEAVISCYFKAMPGLGPEGPIDNSAKCQDTCEAAKPALVVQPDSLGPDQDEPKANTEPRSGEPLIREALYSHPSQGSMLLLKYRCTPFDLL